MKLQKVDNRKMQNKKNNLVDYVKLKTKLCQP